MNLKNLIGMLAILGAIFYSACNTTDPTPVGETFTFSPDTPDLQSAVEDALLMMNDNDIIHFTEGTFLFTGELSVRDKINITIEGEGQDKTILDFSGQVTGAQGIGATNTNKILFRNFTIQNAAGDNIKVKDSDGVNIVNLKAIYTGAVSETNGAYSLYPVTSKNVYIDGCFVRGASDAGIYVGQSENVIVSNNEVTENVAGIEIENCIASDVFNNNVHDNTGGILVFDLPGLPVIENGHQTRVFNNSIKDNNHDNFAPQGNMVGIVPPGSGLMLLACRSIEIFGNEVANNNLMPISMFSYDILQEPNLPETYNTSVHDVYIHDNTITPVSSAYNPNQTELGYALIGAYEGHPDLDLLNNMPDIIWGGFYDPLVTGSVTNNICIGSNGSATFVNLGAQTNFLLLNTDATPHDCSQSPLPEVKINSRK